MSAEFTNHLSLSTNKELLDPNAEKNYKETTWDVVREGIWQGLQDRGKEAQQNVVGTGVEIASAYGIAAGLTYSAMAGGRLRVAAEVVGTVLGATMAVDLGRRGAAIHDTYAKTNDDSIGNAIRKNAIAQYAGAGVFDYTLMLSAGCIGVGTGMKAGLTRSVEAPAPTKIMLSDKLERGQTEKARTLMDIEKVSDDLAFTLDYQISETAMSKISETLQKATHEEFNGILKRLAEKDRKFQGMDLLLTNFDEAAQRWDSVKLHYTDETMITHLIVQKGDTARRIADKETSVNPRRTEDDIEFYTNALIRKNKLTEPDNLNPGRILVLPFAS